MKIIYVSKEITGTLKEAGSFFSSLISDFCGKRIPCFLIARMNDDQTGKFWVAREQLPEEADLSGFTYHLDALCQRINYTIYRIDTEEVYQEIYK